ncbi:RteC domain-containing protein [Sinomicrobium oceani]|uniref:RteC domain-containing protein n=1 Tax=Sinomicrobium oceani TaxID=1150368 RepID=UPI00227A1AFC|nr:RteC domain-containing protein [Sinomicrobium oceani]
MVYDAVIAGFHQELQDIKQVHQSPPDNRRGVLLCHRTLSQLRELVKQTGLDSGEAEIRFFKEIKVIPLSWLICFTEMSSYELQKPRAGKELQKKFYKKQLRKADKFFCRHRDFISYMEQGHTYRDTEYFTRKNPDHVLPWPGEAHYRDPDFSTSHDLLWGRVLGMQRVVEYLRTTGHTPGGGSPGQHQLDWTASKIALTELVYALHNGKVFNHGEADIADITAAFETFFNVRLPQVYKTYTDIRARKGQRVRFLEELIFRLSRKMDEDEAL